MQPIDEYLRTLAGDVVHSFLKTDLNAHLEMDLDPLIVDATVAMPLGLITSELIMNALKYAFPGGRAGTIRIRLKMSGAWPARFPGRLSLIRGLVQQHG